MSLPYAKLACSILDSSIWDEDDATLRIWITLLAMKDKNGVVNAALPGLARRAKKTIPEVEIALAKFMAPDPYSRTPDHEGRRVESTPGGWRILNHALYRDIMAPEERREYERIRKANQRHKPDDLPQGQPQDVPICPGQMGQSANSTHTETETDSEAKTDSEPSEEDIYAEYPRKVAKPDALKAIKKAMKLFDAAFLLARTKQYAAARIGQEKDFTPYPATWFNGQRFNDDPETWQCRNMAVRIPEPNQLQEQITIKTL